MSNWISIEDRKPDYRVNVLVIFTTITGAKQQTVARLTNNTVAFDTDKRCEVWYVTVSGGHKLETITHWMPLPETPEDDK